MKFQDRPSVIEATPWFKNGDHPHDAVTFDTSTGETVTPPVEGRVVRYYRHPDVRGDTVCTQCGVRMHDHGWIDTPGEGHTVCPGDWVITETDGTPYACKPDVFAKIYEPVVDGVTVSMCIKASAAVAQELLDTGLLFEINRRVLHPVGLAMSVYVQDDGTAYVAPLVRTDDAEGIHYWPETLDEGFQKYSAFMKAGGLERLRKREAALGYIEQEIPETKDDV